jgi:hypothetical protein
MATRSRSSASQDCLVSRLLDCLRRKLSIRRLEFLQADDAWTRLAKPIEKIRQPAPDVDGGVRWSGLLGAAQRAEHTRGLTSIAYGRAPLARGGANPGRVGVVSHEPEPSAEHPVKGRSPRVTDIPLARPAWDVSSIIRLWCGNFLEDAVIVWATSMPAADVERSGNSSSIKKRSSLAGISRSACQSPQRTNNQARTAFDRLARSTVERRAGVGAAGRTRATIRPRKDATSWISVHRGPPMRLSLI